MARNCPQKKRSLNLKPSNPVNYAEIRERTAASANVRIVGKEFVASVDSGSDANFIRDDIVLAMNLIIQPEQQTDTGLGQSSVQSMGKV